MSNLSTHVLDAAAGQPAAGVRVALDRRDGDGWQPLGAGVTDDDGRVRDLAPDGLGAGVHRLVFATGEDFTATKQTGFYPEVSVVFEVTDTRRHYHVPLLLSPFAFSTYRGSSPGGSPMAFVLGHNQYGKAENRVVRVFRDRDPHELVDYNVDVALSGGQDAPHLTGDNSPVLPTDTQKNTVYAFAKEDDVVAQPESFGIRLARHFVDNTEPITRARVKLEMYPWSRLNNPHAFVRDGRYVRTATVTYDGSVTWVVSGVKDLVLLKTTDSEFTGYLQDQYTTLPPTTDRVMATSLLAQWYHTSEDVDWGKSYEGVLSALQDTFAGHHSLALQHTLYEMGSAALAGQPEIAEIRFSAPNKHHFVYDLARFGLENDNEVFHADDRPYGLIETTIRRDDAPDPGLAFDPGQGW